MSAEWSREQREAVARAVHAVYVENALKIGETVETNASLVAWEELPETLRDSNRDQAADIARKLAAIDCLLVPLGEGGEFGYTDDELERLAREEHDRWMADRTRDGWTRGAVKDADKKESPDLVPWDDLSEASRQLDRNTVLAIPRVLAAAGLAPTRDAGASRP